MSKKRKVIGEGSYGCVHKPSLNCNTIPEPKFNYDNYVSKLMLNENAKKELKEFLIIDKIDNKNKFHLGNPILCNPKIDKDFKKDIKECSIIDSKKVIENTNDYSLLISKYGGNDLSDFCYNKLKKYLKTKKKYKTAHFFVEIINLFRGLLLFKKHKLIHYDLKPQNILFDENIGKFKYIDFGLMKRKNEIIKNSKKNKNNSGIIHWSYPLECGFMNKEDFDLYTSNANSKLQVKQKFLNEIVLNKQNIKYPLLNNLFDIKRPGAFNLIFSYINTDLEIPSIATKNEYVRSFFYGFDELISRENYDTILNIIIDNIDIYGLGFSLLFCLNHFYKLNAISITNYILFEKFFYNMCNFNPLLRVYNIENLLNGYQNLLVKSGFLQEYEKNIKNSIFTKNIIKDEFKNNDTNEKLSHELKEEAHFDPPIRETKICPDDKELNPNTNRCINKCKNGYERNTEFKCVKTKKNKNNDTNITRKICPDDKELNPKTKRCINKCKNGYERNTEFKCIKTK
jgi:serine/threonine protein kinase